MIQNAGGNGGAAFAGMMNGIAPIIIAVTSSVADSLLNLLFILSSPFSFMRE
jgi:sorbitol-specific phosphotransferase system component IIC